MQPIFSKLSLIAVACLAAYAAPGLSYADDDIDNITIVGMRDNRVSEGATGLALDIQETPQSISIVNRELMDLFGTDDINSALDLVTGIRVERWETNRTNYVSRGFEIKSTQIDGVGLPNSWGLVEGAIDSFGYEQIEVIRGANGLLTGLGNASGTINYIRKRPLNEKAGEVGVSIGSYAQYRVQADYSSPLTGNGDWAGRVVVAADQANSYLRGYSSDRQYIYGVVDGQLTDVSSIAVGYSYQNAQSDGVMWGGLTFSNLDGTQAEFDVGASTAQDWTYWDNINQSAFVEYNHLLSAQWQLQLSYNYRAMESDSKLLFAYSYEGLDPDTAEGLVGWPGRWPGQDKANIYEAKLTGYFDWLGESHQVIVGASTAKNKNDSYMHPFSDDEPAYAGLPAFPYAGTDIPEPVWGPKTFDSQTEDTLRRYYAVTQLEFSQLALTLGFNAVSFERDSTTLETTLKGDEVSPYAGISYQFTSEVMAYVSYSDIYQPQDYYDVTGDYLDPTKGTNYEVGVKTAWFDKNLIANLAWFKAEQLGLGIYAGLNTDTGQYYYQGQDTYSEGVELELQGKLYEQLQFTFGATLVDVEDENDQDVYGWVPEKTVNLSVFSSLPQNDDITLGLSAKWQSEISRVDSYTGYPVSQPAYAKLDAFATWDINEQSRLRLNIDNLTDEKYITSLWEIGFYAAPRQYKLSYQYSF
ncbi:TonB-dependent siderophore receptor [Neptunicella sp. SCSIO 80796]|uniref:TonB-dependent siderophore receptor n=1 Tax=Neptunicella plasticusilytica TaxID=3117012 RepID=UPI003A4E5C4C